MDGRQRPNGEDLAKAFDRVVVINLGAGQIAWRGSRRGWRGIGHSRPAAICGD